MKLLPLTVNLNAAAPAVMAPGASEVMDGTEFGVIKHPRTQQPDSVIAARTGMMMSARDPRYRHGVVARCAIHPIAQPRCIAGVVLNVGIRGSARTRRLSI
jgi:hypothetical protein